MTLYIGMGDSKLKKNMKKYISVWTYLLVILTILACSDANDFPVEGSGDNNGLIEDPINDFVWKGLNSWYNWQTESVLLDDAKDDVPEDYANFLNTYTDYETLMLDLCYKHSKVVGAANSVDRFSWFIEDYDIQNQAFQGIRTRFGFTSKMINLNDGTDKVVILVAMVEPNSPAGDAQMKRGDLMPNCQMKP